jgi:hypothetical protein
LILHSICSCIFYDCHWQIVSTCCTFGAMKKMCVCGIDDGWLTGIWCGIVSHFLYFRIKFHNPWFTDYSELVINNIPEQLHQQITQWLTENIQCKIKSSSLRVPPQLFFNFRFSADSNSRRPLLKVLTKTFLIHDFIVCTNC